MREHEPTTRMMKIIDVEKQFSELVDAVARNHTRIVVEDAGVPVAALISATDLEQLARFERNRTELFKVIDELREAFKDVPPEEIERETDRAVAELRGKVPAPA